MLESHDFFQADHKGGAGELLGQAGGHDAHHPLVPAVKYVYQ